MQVPSLPRRFACKAHRALKMILVQNHLMQVRYDGAVVFLFTLIEFDCRGARLAIPVIVLLIQVKKNGTVIAIFYLFFIEFIACRT